MSNVRVAGKCIQCREQFNIQKDKYVKYGGGLWCSEDCLAQWSVEAQDRGMLAPDIKKVEQEYEVVKNE